MRYSVDAATSVGFCPSMSRKGSALLHSATTGTHTAQHTTTARSSTSRISRRLPAP